MNTTSPFEQLLAAAAAQSEPQRLLFVFAGADLPEDATPAQRTSFEEGAGGELTPLMCVEKTLDELTSFQALVDESRQAGPPWRVVFAAGLAGRNGALPSGAQTEAALTALVERIRGGFVEGLLALSPCGDSLTFT
jgi:hypothetical protein